MRCRSSSWKVRQRWSSWRGRVTSSEPLISRKDPWIWGSTSSSRKARAANGSRSDRKTCRGWFPSTWRRSATRGSRSSLSTTQSQRAAMPLSR